MNQTITKNTLAKEVFYHTGIPVSIAEDIVENMFELIIEHTAKEGEVKLANFGTFSAKEKKARLGRNLNTKESVMITSRKVVSFRPSLNLKQVINEEI